MSKGSSINTTVTSTVILGSVSYSSPLTITSTGGIRPSYFDAIGVFVPAGLSGGSILNDGHVYGAYGSSLEFSQSYGGTGVDLEGSAKLVSHGIIEGGAGATTFTFTRAGSGGYGLIVRAGSSITNQGSIYGGVGGYGHHYGGFGGTGMEDDGAAKFSNTGIILGGAGGESGAIGAQGGGGLVLTGAATASNSGYIGGGTGGYSVYRYRYAGHARGAQGAQGGTGVLLDQGSKLTNTGLIAGGSGGGGEYIAGGSGEGGEGGFLFDGTLINNGNIYGGFGGDGGKGGAGIVIGGYGDTRGTGTLNVVDNIGTIDGGNGGPLLVEGFAGGGLGIYLNSGTLINSGTIIGGLGGSLGLSRAAAVEFGGSAGTLVVDPGAVFEGGIYANSKVADVLELTGKSKQAFGGFAGFTNISFATGAAWTIETDEGLLAGGGQIPETISGFTSADKIEIFDAGAAKGTVKVNTNGVVTIYAGTKTIVLDIAGAVAGSNAFKFSNYTLTEKSGATAAMQFIRPEAAAATTTTAMPDLHAAAPAASTLAAPSTRLSGWAPLEIKTIDYTGAMNLVTLTGAGL